MEIAPLSRENDCLSYHPRCKISEAKEYLISVSVIFVGRDYTGVELQKDSQQADSLRYSPRR